MVFAQAGVVVIKASTQIRAIANNEVFNALA